MKGELTSQRCPTLPEMVRVLHAHRVQSFDIISAWEGLPCTRLVSARDTVPAVVAVESPLQTVLSASVTSFASSHCWRHPDVIFIHEDPIVPAPVLSNDPGQQ